jgi:RimJ/RimL family protein N-acetyltransferase
LDLNRLFLETYDVRKKHIQIIEDSGFVLEGRLKQHVIINGAFIDSLIHGMVKSDYDESKNIY